MKTLPLIFSLFMIVCFYATGCSTPSLPSNPKLDLLTKQTIENNREIEEEIRVVADNVDSPELVIIADKVADQTQNIEVIGQGIAIKDELINSQDVKIDELEDDLESGHTKYLGVLIAFGAIIMTLGVLGFFFNAKAGVILLGIGGITVAVSAATMIYMGWFALIGLITLGLGFLLMLIYLARLLFTGRKLGKELKSIKTPIIISEK